MIRKNKLEFVYIFFLCLMFLVFPNSSNAIILHNDNQPSSHPPDAIIGRWSTNASCVAISPNHIITTRHQGGGLGTTVELNEINYKVAQIYEFDGVDLRIARIIKTDGSNAELPNFIQLYTFENEIGAECVIGGYGKKRQRTLYISGSNPPKAYGYVWSDSFSPFPIWCTNKIQGNTEVSDNYTSKVLVNDFDDLRENMSWTERLSHKPTDNEGVPAEFDSGGGWFINHSGQWHLLAVTRGVQFHKVDSEFQSWFRNNTTGELQPDQFDGVRISQYYQDATNHISNTKKISGTINNLNGSGISYVNINSENDYAGFTRTDSSGYYELWVPDGWSGTITPSKSGYAFNPTNLTFSNITADTPNQDFTLVTRTLSGEVFNTQGNSLANVTIDANNGAISSITDTNGKYAITIPYNWSGTITPAKPGYNFIPSFYDFNSVTTNITGKNFDTNDVNFISDNFDDNTTSANWISISDSSLEVTEANQTLQYNTNGFASGNSAYYKSNGWTIDTNDFFSLKTGFQNNISSPNDFTAYLKIKKDPNNYALAAIGTDSLGNFYKLVVATSSQISETNDILTSSSGTLAIFYDKPADKLYLNIGDYADIQNALVFENLSTAGWNNSQLSVEIAIQCSNCQITPPDFYFDNFTLNTGNILNWPSRTDIDTDGFITFNDFYILISQWLTVGPDGDIDNNQIVNFTDLAYLAQIW